VTAPNHDPASVRRLAIADPPYPPFVGSGGRKNRASRWYGKGQRSRTDCPPDFHPDAHEWDSPARHRQLLLDLLREYDGFAIATSPDGLAAYGELPAAARVLVWVKPNAQPGSHRIRSMWEAVILYPPAGRRSNRGGVGATPDVLVAPAPRGFRGEKPTEWVEWVLAALTHDPANDVVDDLFPGSGAVTRAVTAGMTDARPRPEPPVSSAAKLRIDEALALLHECLWDEEPWDNADLVERMEAIYVALGGDLSGP
jgi:hypothetical protein